MHLVDTHAHLDYFSNENKIESLLENAKKSSVTKIVNCSARFFNWQMYSDLAKKYEDTLYWTIGIHPTEHEPEVLDQLDALCQYFSDGKYAPRAIGEIGLDFFRLPKDLEEREKTIIIQKAMFKKQLGFARDLDCKICIHARSAIEESIEMMKNAKIDFRNVVFHCYSGTPAQMSEINKLGGRASFTGIITYKNAQEMRDAMITQGLEKIMFETDCPYLAPEPFRSKKNEPAFIKQIVEYAASVFKMPFEELAEISTQNATDFFDLR